MKMADNLKLGNFEWKYFVYTSDTYIVFKVETETKPGLFSKMSDDWRVIECPNHFFPFVLKAQRDWQMFQSLIWKNVGQTSVTTLWYWTSEVGLSKGVSSFMYRYFREPPKNTVSMNRSQNPITRKDSVSGSLNSYIKLIVLLYTFSSNAR